LNNYMNTQINNIKSNHKRPDGKDDLNYDRLSTVDVIERIAIDRDHNVLHYFLEKRKIFYHTNRWLVLSDYIRAHSTTGIPGYILSAFVDKEEFGNQVYDLTLRRFTPMYFANSTSRGKRGSSGTSESTSAGCFKLYYLVLEGMKSWRDENPEATQLEEERQVGILFQGLINWHFCFCIKEAIRKANRLQKRYTWQIENGSVTVYRPVWISVSEFRSWLEEHIDNPDRKRPGEKERIQHLVDVFFSSGGFIPFDTVEEEAYKYPEIYESPVYLESHDETNVLAHRVAIKKELEIERLRPAIQSLGKENIKRLVLRILNDLADGQYNTSRIIEEFNLSKAALSRFAGIRWNISAESAAKQRIPDLWRNVAEVVMSDPESIESAVSVGTKEIVQTICESSGPNNKGNE